MLGIISLVGVAVALLISDREAAPTMNIRIDAVSPDGTEVRTAAGH